MPKKKTKNKNNLEWAYLSISITINIIVFFLLFTPYSFRGYTVDFFFYFIAGLFSLFGIYIIIRLELKKKWLSITTIILQLPALVAVLFAFLSLVTPYATLGTVQILEPISQELIYSENLEDGQVDVYKSNVTPYGVILTGKQPVTGIPFLEKTIYVKEDTILAPIKDPNQYDEKDLLRCNLKVYLKKDVVEYFEIIYSEEIGAYSMKFYHPGDSASQYTIQCQESYDIEMAGQEVTVIPWFGKTLPDSADIYFTPEEEYIILVNGMTYKFALIEGNGLSWQDFQVEYVE